MIVSVMVQSMNQIGAFETVLFDWTVWGKKLKTALQDSLTSWYRITQESFNLKMYTKWNLMQNFSKSQNTKNQQNCIWFGLIGFYGISTIVGYLIPDPLYTYILNIYDLLWFAFMAYQPL